MNKLNFIFAIIIAFSLSACSKFDSSYFEYKVGDEKVECKSLCNPLAYYLTDNDVTNIEVSSNAGKHALNIIVPKNITGEWTNIEGAYILYTQSGTTDYEAHDDMSGAISLTVTITEYGNIGDYIEGTFSGELADEFDNIIVISEGKFKVKREKDDY